MHSFGGTCSFPLLLLQIYSSSKLLQQHASLQSVGYSGHLSADTAARCDASAALVDHPEAAFDASAAAADALIAVDTFCLQA